MAVRAVLLALLVLLYPIGVESILSAAACGFSPQDYPESVRDAIQHIERGDYRRAVPILEDGWDADPENIQLAETLGFAYQYSISRSDKSVMLKKAAETMEETMSSGGAGMFLMDYANTEKKKLQGLDRGQVRISKQSLDFCSIRSDFTMSIPLASIASYGFSRKVGADESVFWLSKGGKDQMLFRPSTFTADEVEALFNILNKLTGLSPTPVEK